MDKITLIDGNGRPYTLGLPRLVILAQFNEVALRHIEESTHLVFTPCWNGIAAQPTEAKQIVALLMTYNFKTRFFNNHSEPNTMYLRSDHHVGFDVQSICYECAKYNNIQILNLDPSSRLGC